MPRVDVFKTMVLVFLVPLLLLAFTACSEEGRPVKGFVLPQGDLAQGEQVFVDFKCHGCHTIPGKEFPALDFTPPFVLEIGGEVYRVKNYGELMTSVVAFLTFQRRLSLGMPSPQPGALQTEQAMSAPGQSDVWSMSWVPLHVGQFMLSDVSKSKTM